MQRPLDPRAVIVAEGSNTLDNVVDVFLGDRVGRQQHLAAGESRLGLTPKIHDHLEELPPLSQTLQRIADVGRQNIQQLVEVVGDDLRWSEWWAREHGVSRQRFWP